MGSVPVFLWKPIALGIFQGYPNAAHPLLDPRLRGYKTTEHTIIVDEEMINDLNIKDIHLVLVLVQLSECNSRACPTIIPPAKSRSDVMFCLQSYGTYLS